MGMLLVLGVVRVSWQPAVASVTVPCQSTYAHLSTVSPICPKVLKLNKMF